jgi:enediyne biosynthesis protein E4
MKAKLPVLAAALLGAATLPHLLAEVTITRHPTDQVVSLNAHVTNSVTASSTAPPIAYQWYGKGVLLPEQTSRTLVLNNIQLDQAGEYYVVVNDAHNQPAQSNPATVTVDPTFIKITEGAIVTDREPSLSSTWWDYDGDGHLDLYVANNACLNGCPATNSLYHNLGDGTFQRVTNLLSTRVVRSSTVATADFDNNGTEDLYVLGNTAPQYDPNRYPPDELYRNEGGGTFLPLRGQPWSRDVDTSNDCGWADYDRDGLLDVFVANVYETYAECLYRQRTDGSFVKMTAAQAGSIVGVNLSTDACSWADYDNDGDPDLWLSSRDGRARLHQNGGQGYFSAATNAGSVTTINANCTGVWGDYDNDGWLDLYAVSLPDGPVTAVNALHRNLQGTSFTNVALAAGVALANNAWASAWGDYDNDGWLDIFVANITGGTNLLYRNRGDGTFEKLDVGSPIRDGDLRATVAWVDYDNDGFLDLFITCGNGTALPNHLYRNNSLSAGNANHWLKVKLIGQAANRSGIGAKIRVKATIGGQEIWQVREISGNSGYQGGYGLMAHFGLGDATMAGIVRVEWPSGNVQELTDVPADHLRSITEQVLITPVRPSSSLGGSVTLTAQLNGTWQWYHDGVALDGKTAKTLTLSNIQAADAGRYSVVVTTATGTVTNHVYLLVDPTFTRITDGPVVEDVGPWCCWTSWGDLDGDGLLDLFVPANYDPASPGRVQNALYRNLGADNFVRVTSAATANLSQSWCGLWADFDNNGTLDLFVVHPFARRNELFRNDGSGVLSPVACGATAVAADHSGAAWVDLDRDGLLDLLVTTENGQKDYFFRGLGDETFIAWATDEVGPVVGTLARNYSPAFCDIDRDGHMDLHVANAVGRNFLYRNDGAGRLEPLTAGSLPAAAATCSAVWADLDNDGLFDLLTTDYTAATDTAGVLKLHRNLGGWQFEDATVAAGLASSAGGWGIAVGDFDNDADLDIYFPNYNGRDLLFVNAGDGTFTPADVGSPLTEGIRDGAVWVDYNNDGFLDLFKTSGDNTPAQNRLYRNSLKAAGNTNGWLKIRLVGTRSNRSAIGACLWAEAVIQGHQVQQVRHIQSGVQSAAGLSGLDAHFGLGDAPRATTVRVEWPSGTVEEFSNLERDQFHTIVEPSLQGGMLAGGQFELTVTATLNRVRTIEVSSDLVEWKVLTTVTGQGETSVTYIDTDAPGQDHRFYRMR